jgi:hypothetical protein
VTRIRATNQSNVLLFFTRKFSQQDAKQRQLHQHFEEDETFQPQRLFEHEEIVVRFDMKFKQSFRERWDESPRHNRLRIDQNCRRYVRGKVRYKYSSQKVVHFSSFDDDFWNRVFFSWDTPTFLLRGSRLTRVCSDA